MPSSEMGQGYFPRGSSAEVYQLLSRTERERVRAGKRSFEAIA